MKRTKIARLLQSDSSADQVLVKGWVRTRRDSKTFSFMELNDGSCLKNLQVIVEDSVGNYEQIKTLGTGSALSVTGKAGRIAGKGPEMGVASRVRRDRGRIFGKLSLAEKTPQRRVSEIHRPFAAAETNKYGAAFRIRSELSFAIHKFFRERDFFYVHTPIITGSDCEGAGEMFRVTALDLDDVPKKGGAADYGADFFGKEANLTVSGQLSAEMFALSLGDVYTFGPTFRAENSNTRRHAAEFWMIEPEMAFCDIYDNMDVGEDLIKYLVSHVMDNRAEDIELFARFVDKGLMSRLETTLSKRFVRIEYKDALDIVEKSGQKFEYELSFGKGLQAEHERFLTEKHFKGPVIVYNYPNETSPFYMRVNDDGKTVAGMDVLLPLVGEIIGGSQREERLDVLLSRMEELGLKQEDYWWFIDSRRFGSVPHSGFGLGFERMVMFVTGISNIRDVIPFPRTPKSIDF